MSNETPSGVTLGSPDRVDPNQYVSPMQVMSHSFAEPIPVFVDSSDPQDPDKYLGPKPAPYSFFVVRTEVGNDVPENNFYFMTNAHASPPEYDGPYDVYFQGVPAVNIPVDAGTETLFFFTGERCVVFTPLVLNLPG